MLNIQLALEEIHHQRASIPGQLILQNAQPSIDTHSFLVQENITSFWH
ncbi:hypothetical protein H6G95_27700 [Nostoc linckia FACHB-391]|uniref:Uncharacterized protein n=2 Tax=Nostoc TaxID=1177 RepID=A0ABR8IHW1_9NOSO|nr:hypothetical protein [Nostoc linckia FACHB-391]MBD2650773.1 hypothetical protein [Nostoc foliaceum FACHB-393]